MKLYTIIIADLPRITSGTDAKLWLAVAVHTHTVRVCADAKARVSACPNRSAEKMERYGREASTLFFWNRPPGLPVM